MSAIIAVSLGLAPCAAAQPVFPANRYSYRIVDSVAGYRDDVVYRGPWAIEDAAEREAWLGSAAPSLDPPFSEGAAVQGGGWAYHGGGAHHAVDYTPLGAPAFEVLAPCSGTVVFAGWDDWSGNTVVIESGDGLRVILMHLRNGAAADHERASKTDVSGWSKEWQSTWQRYLDTYDDDRREAYWGKDDTALRVAIGDKVSAGDSIGWTGDTGPGGMGLVSGGGGPNVHLHMFTARRWRDEWVFIDPDGLYGTTNRWLEPVSYPSAWRRVPVEWSVECAVASDEFLERFGQRAKDSLFPLDISCAPAEGEDGGALTALWMRLRIPYYLYVGLSPGDFAEKDDDLRRQGFRPSAIAPLITGDGTLYAATWLNQREESARDLSVPLAVVPERVRRWQAVGYYVQSFALHGPPDARLCDLVLLRDPIVGCELEPSASLAYLDAGVRDRAGNGFRPARIQVYGAEDARQACVLWWADKPREAKLISDVAASELEAFAEQCRADGLVVTSVTASLDGPARSSAIAVRR